MRSIQQALFALVLLTAVGAAGAAASEASGLTLAATSRIYVTLVPRAAEPDDGPRLLEGTSSARPGLNLAMPYSRRNRLEFSLTQRDVLQQGDRLQLRLASDAHIVAQLLSGGQFSDADDSWIAVLGLTSRLRLSYTNGPWELSMSARRRFGDGNVKARLSYAIHF